MRKNLVLTENTGSSEDPILTTREAARLLGVAVSTAQLWIESGTIASWKTPGGHRRVRSSSVLEVLHRHGAKQDSHRSSGSDTRILDSEFLPLASSSYPVPPDEFLRLQALGRTKLVDSPNEPVFDRLTWLASQIAGTPIALVSLLTSSRQWFKSRFGLEVCETPREAAFCSHAILEDTPFIVKDTHLDSRFSSNPLVTGEPFIRFYAGFQLWSKNRLRLGTLCVIDTKPRTLDDNQLLAMQELTTIASEEIQRRE